MGEGGNETQMLEKGVSYVAKVKVCVCGVMVIVRMREENQDLENENGGFPIFLLLVPIHVLPRPSCSKLPSITVFFTLPIMTALCVLNEP